MRPEVRPHWKGMMAMTPLLLIVATIFVLPVLARVVRTLLEVLVRLVAGAVGIGVVLLVVVALVTHGHLS